LKFWRVAAGETDTYPRSGNTQSFELLVGAGMIVFRLRRASNIHWQAVEINKAIRSRLKGHKPAILWSTGISGLRGLLRRQELRNLPTRTTGPSPQAAEKSTQDRTVI